MWGGGYILRPGSDPGDLAKFYNTGLFKNFIRLYLILNQKFNKVSFFTQSEMNISNVLMKILFRLHSTFTVIGQWPPFMKSIRFNGNNQSNQNVTRNWLIRLFTVINDKQYTETEFWRGNIATFYITIKNLNTSLNNFAWGRTVWIMQMIKKKFI